jgi:hypothetical protein
MQNLTARPSSPHSWISRRLVHVCVALLAVLVYAAPATAQLARIGINPTLINTGMRGSDVAYDPVNNVYLTVGAYGTAWGVFTDTSGVGVSTVHLNNTTSGFAHFPRVAYSPHVSNGAGGQGGFLVTWHENVGLSNYVHTRIVAYPNRLVSSTQVISSTPTWWEAGAAVAYSPVSRVFLVTWRAGDYAVWAARIGLDGAQIGPLVLVSPTGSRDPNVAWNPHTDEFGIVFTGFSGGGTTTSFARVSPGGTVIRVNTFNFAGVGTFITDIAFNTATSRYLAVWWQSGTQAAEIDSAGDVLAAGLLSTGTGTYDGLGVSYNQQSGTFLLVGHGQSEDVWAAELNSRGARTSSDVVVTSGGAGFGSFYPRVTANPSSTQWDLTYSHGFMELRDQVVSTSSNGGGPGGTLGSVSAPPPPSDGGGSTGGCPGTAPFPGAVCVNGGWVPGTGDSGGSGGGDTGGCPGTAPFPGAVCVNGGWVPGTGDSGGSGGGDTGGCPGTAPFPGAVCVNGGWIPGTGDSGGSGGSTGGCPGTAPFPGAVCVNGGWIPGTGDSGGSGGSTGGCPGTAPFPGAVCVNGGWVPGTGDSSGGSTGGCPGTAPFPGAVCVNGGWVPGDSSGSSTSCPGTAPFPGAVCVNGGWVPGSEDTSSCSTPDPFVAIGGGICINGGWIPKTEE